jgi:competence protein ComGF
LKYTRENYTIDPGIQQGLFIGPPVAWAPKRAEEQIANNLNLPLHIHYASDYGEYLGGMLDCLERRNGHSGRCIMYNYFPSTIKAAYNISRVSLPEHTPECYEKGDEGGIDCDYDYFILYKIVWSQLSVYAPDAYHVLQQFKLTKNDQENMLSEVMKGKGYYDIACEWIHQNRNRWQTWIPLDFADEPPQPSAGSVVEETPEWVFVLVYALAGTLGAVLLIILVAWLVWTVRSRIALQRQVKAALKQKVQECRHCLRSLPFPMYLVDGRTWMSLEVMTRHENLRDSGMLKALDTLKTILKFQDSGNIIAFFSHQWLGSKNPDPKGKQWCIMTSAMADIAKRENRPLEKAWGWVDYSGIPQHNRNVQMFAIDALPSYAANSNYFIVVAPSARHSDTGVPQDQSTYNSRMWCRAEHLSRISQCGVRDFYFAESSGLCSGPELLQESWETYLADVMNVFSGNATCCSERHKRGSRTLSCDRQRLVTPMMSLIASLQARVTLGMSDLDDESQAWIQRLLANIETFFPKTYIYLDMDSSKEMPLFGDLVREVFDDVKEQPFKWLGPGKDFISENSVEESGGVLLQLNVDSDNEEESDKGQDCCKAASIDTTATTRSRTEKALQQGANSTTEKFDCSQLEEDPPLQVPGALPTFDCRILPA